MSTPEKKKSSLHGPKISGVTRCLFDRIISIWLLARKNSWDDKHIRAQREEQIFGHPDYARLPTYAKEYLRGAWDMGFERTWREDLEWRLKFRGRWLTSYAGNRRLSEIDRPTTEEIPTGHYWELTEGAHFWVGTDAPYNRDFRMDVGVSDPQMLRRYLESQLRDEGHIYCIECGSESKNLETRLCRDCGKNSEVGK